MIKRFVDWLHKIRFSRRKQACLDSCGCVCFCPNCGDILNDQAEVVDKGASGVVTFKCVVCGTESDWLLDTPVPILLELKKKGKWT